MRGATVSTLASLRQKIKSIETTKKITHAVRLTSMSLYAKLEKRCKPLDNYAHAVESLFKKIVLADDELRSPVLFPDDLMDRNPLYIVISTAKGLCGSLNSNLFRYLKGTLYIDEHQKPSWIIVGQKAVNFINENHTGKVRCSYAELTSNNFVTIADDIVEQIMTAQPSFSSVTFFHSELKSVFIQKPKKYNFIPFLLDDADAQRNAEFDDFLWEQDRTCIADSLTMRYIRSMTMNVLFQSLITEHAARFVAMDSASTNADKMLEQLVLNYNKMRQALITQEVSELSASSTQ